MHVAAWNLDDILGQSSAGPVEWLPSSGSGSITTTREQADDFETKCVGGQV